MSDQDNSIFDNGAPASNQPKETNANPLANLLGEIRNEQGQPKYRTVEDALVALRHAQEFIPKIKNESHEKEAELAELRAKVQRMDELERTVQQITQSQAESQTRGVVPKPEDIEAIVSQTLSKRQAAEKHAANQKLVTQTLVNAFGAENAEATFYTKAAELDYTKEQINALAAENPKALFKLMGISEQGANKQPLFAPTRSSVNTEAFSPNQQSAIRRNDRKVELGESRDEIAEYRTAGELVKELHSQGLTMADLSNPKIHKQYFGY